MSDSHITGQLIREHKDLLAKAIVTAQYQRQSAEWSQYEPAHHVTFIAHSVSCMIGTLVALKQPELIARMIFIGASPRYLDDVNYVGGFTCADVSGLLNAMAADYVGWATNFATVAVNAPNQPEAVAEFRGVSPRCVRTFR